MRPNDDIDAGEILGQVREFSRGLNADRTNLTTANNEGLDIEASISRVMPQIITPEHLQQAQQLKQLSARYQQSRDLLSVGAYVPGGDPETDLAIAKQQQMAHYLRQGLNEGGQQLGQNASSG